jgi:flagellar basal-body rod modification protein FlgD
MAVATVNGASTASAGNLGIQDFLRILTTQLNNQDPLKPMDNQQFVAQLAQFTSLQQTQQMNQKLDALLSIQAANQSVGLIGRSVDVQTASGQSSGRVTAFSFASGEPRMTITLDNGSVVKDLSLSSLITVR